MRNRSFVLVAVWLIGTGFAMGMASFAVQLARSRRDRGRCR
ncbi:MAG: hypothetical protein R2699_09275 [Acidimicrobiales bacterium]